MRLKFTPIFLIPAAFCLLILVGCNGGSQPADTPSPYPKATIKPTATPIPDGAARMSIDPNIRYIATIITNLGSIEIELFPKEAPKTVNNFVTLSKNGFYNEVIFHRVIPNVMIQGGDPTGTGGGGPGYTFEDEFHSTLSFDKPGLLAMANSGPNTNGSQFFIILKATPWLDNKHSVFGRVVSGQDVIDAIVSVERDSRDKPLQEIKMMSVTITE